MSEPEEILEDVGRLIGGKWPDAYPPAVDANHDNAGINTTCLKALRVFSIVEGVSTLLLFFVAMPLKYGAGVSMAVTIVGSAHGALFTMLVFAFVAGYQLVPLPGKLACLGVGAAIIPYGPFWLDGKLRALGQEDRRE